MGPMIELRVGEHLGPLLPFTNAYEFTGVPWFSGPPLLWGGS
jgi:hypothetical protein